MLAQGDRDLFIKNIFTIQPEVQTTTALSSYTNNNSWCHITMCMFIVIYTQTNFWATWEQHKYAVNKTTTYWHCSGLSTHPAYIEQYSHLSSVFGFLMNVQQSLSFSVWSGVCLHQFPREIYGFLAVKCYTVCNVHSLRTVQTNCNKKRMCL